MYMQLPEPDKRCSQCGTVNQTEVVIKDRGFAGRKTYLRCIICGHKKLIREETHYPETTDYHVYNLRDRPKVEEF